jgi:hypothetical protein
VWAKALKTNLPNTRTFGRTFMKHSFLGVIPSNGQRLISALCFFALVPGCTTSHSSSPTSPARFQTLDGSLSALKAEFNRDPSKPRLLAPVLAYLWRVCLRGTGAATGSSSSDERRRERRSADCLVADARHGQRARSEEVGPMISWERITSTMATNKPVRV